MSVSHAVVGVLLVAATVGCSPAADPPPGPVDKLFEALRDGKGNGLGFPALGMADVPALLARADSETPLPAVPTNPVSSYAQRSCSEGMLALWLVEGVRKGGKYPSLNP